MSKYTSLYFKFKIGLASSFEHIIAPFFDSFNDISGK